MLSNSLLSVIIPVFNRQGLIADAIDSVLCQDYTPFELIVVNDGSTDKTAEALKAYEPWIKTINQKNAGAGAARNRGIDAAHGEWLAFLDSDDYWLPEKAKTQMEFFRQNPDIKVCHTEEYRQKKDKLIYPYQHMKKKSGWIFEASLRYCLMYPSAVILHKSVMGTTGGFDETLPDCEDYDLWLKIASRYQIGLINEPCFVKRNIGHRRSDKFFLQNHMASIGNLLKSDFLAPDQKQFAKKAMETKGWLSDKSIRKSQ